MQTLDPSDPPLEPLEDIEVGLEPLAEDDMELDMELEPEAIELS